MPNDFKSMIKLLKNILLEIKYFFRSLDVLVESKKNIPKIIFFSENKSYQKYLRILIDTTAELYPNKIYYLSIDRQDIIYDDRIKNFYINPFLINFIFSNINAENLILTLTDLDNNLLKKTKNIKKYIYYFHSPVSTTKNYTSGAFDNYDTIMCVGQFQINEIRLRENLKKLKKKNLISTGYFYFDHLKQNLKKNISPDEILIAPSWNKNLKNFINENFILLIENLLKKKFKVIFRPHPEHFKRSKNILNKMEKIFNKNFKIDYDDSNIISMQKAKCLITDSSGIAIEYMIVLKRPVLYLDECDKIHNLDFQDFTNLNTLDYKVKKNFGYFFKKKDFSKIETIINLAQGNFNKNKNNLDDFVKSHYFNFGCTREFLYTKLKEIL